jgi:hypothetical protein
VWRLNHNTTTLNYDTGAAAGIELPRNLVASD